MLLNRLNDYKAFILDYSVLREFGGTAVYSEFIDIVTAGCVDVYVSKTFKLLHYCIIHQADLKDAATSSAMRTLCNILLPIKKLHSVDTADTSLFLKAVADIPDSIIVTTKFGIFTKRLYEIDPDFDIPICVISDSEINFYDNIKEMIRRNPLPDVSPLAFKNSYLDTKAYCNVGDYVTTANEKSLELTKRLSSGAEGMVFLTSNKNVVAKIYHKGAITPLRWCKLTKMVSMHIKSAGICWPQDLLFYRGQPVGYTMFLGKGKTLSSVFDGPDAIFNNFPEWKREDVISTLVNLLEKYLYLHMHNIVAGDIQLKNALLYSSNASYLIDMDSVQVGNLPCPVGTEEFTDPALWGRNFSGFVRSLKDEDYSIAMLVFSIMFCGLHPFATRHGAETLKEEIEMRNFPYSLDNDNEEHIPLGGYNYIWQYLPDDLRNLLYNTFKLGKRYEAVVWYDAVLSYKEDLVGKKFTDPESYKVFPKMDYKATEEAVMPQAGDRNNVAPGVKSRFSDFNNNVVFKPLNSSDHSSNQNPSGSASPFSASGRYTPKTEDKVQEPAQPEKKKRLFGGLFGN